MTFPTKLPAQILMPHRLTFKIDFRKLQRWIAWGTIKNQDKFGYVCLITWNCIKCWSNYGQDNEVRSDQAPSYIFNLIMDLKPIIGAFRSGEKVYKQGSQHLSLVILCRKLPQEQSESACPFIRMLLFCFNMKFQNENWAWFRELLCWASNLRKCESCPSLPCTRT